MDTENEGLPKRGHVETGDTPNKPARKKAGPRNPLSSVSPGPRKSLFDSNKQKVSPRPSVVCTRQSKITISPKLLREKKRTRINWPHKEDVALVQFVALHKDLQASTIEWPQPSPESDYWDKAAGYIQQVAGTPYRRQGSSVRKRVANHMKKKWDTVDEAEEDLGFEFTKRMDPDLPFYYHTLNERFSADLLPSFDEIPTSDDVNDEPKHNPYRLHRLVRSTREDASVFSAGRSFLPARNRVSVRQRFFRHDVGLPPVLPNQQIDAVADDSAD